jgi:NAD(P)H-hydrate epimerase
MLAASSVLRAGAGMVTLVLPDSLVPFVDVQIPEVIVRGAPETPEGSLSEAALPLLLSLASTRTVLAIGPGLGLHASTQQLIDDFLHQCPLPQVIDADALRVVHSKNSGQKTSPILTPHEGELARMLGCTREDIHANRESYAKEAACRFNAIVALKGHATIVTEGSHLYMNDTGNPGMATAGMGDVLTGVVAGLLAQGMTPWDAACVGVRLHGAAGDLAYETLAMGLIASDVRDRIPLVLR